MAQSETVERILDAAEQLFAEKGFAETSLRLITSKAGVNLAAVNYHFGSKEELFEAVLTRRLDPMNQQRLARELRGFVHHELDIRDRAGVLALIIKALSTMFKQCPKDLTAYILMAAAFAAVAFFNVSVLLVIASCAAVGLAVTLLAAGKEGAA